MRWPWRRRKPLGAHGEDLAAKALRRAGYRILDRNAKLGRYEIDIIAQEGDTVAFVEVKTRQAAGDTFDPVDNITPEKQRRLAQAARYYLARHPDTDANYRFDVVAVVVPPRGRPDITIYRDAFPAR